MKYEFVFVLSCECSHQTDFSSGVQDDDVEPTDFGDCPACETPYQKISVDPREIE